MIDATAAATCTAGTASLSGQTTLTGVTVLGTPVDAYDPAGKVLSLDTAQLSLSQLVNVTSVLKSITVNAPALSIVGLAVGSGNQSLYDVLTTPSGLLGTVNAALPLGTTIASILSGLDLSLQPVLTGNQIPLPAGILHAVITPRTEVDNGSSITETALAVNMTSLTQPLLSGELARASVSANAPGCVAPTTPVPTTPGPTTPTATAPAPTTPTQTTPTPTTPAPTTPHATTPTPTTPPSTTPAPVPPASTPAASTPVASTPSVDVSAQARWSASFAARVLACGNPALRLTDVPASGGRTLVQGVAQARYIGETATIYATAGNSKVGSVKVNANGQFSTLVPLPAARIASTNAARYYAIVSGQKSAALKFARRMYTTSLTATKGIVTLEGRITTPRSRAQADVVIQRQESCTKYVAVGKTTPNAKGHFSITFKAPAGATSAIYRAQTAVPKSTRSKRAFATYTLPKLLMFG